MAIILPQRGYPGLDKMSDMLNRLIETQAQEQSKMRMAEMMSRLKQQEQAQRGQAFGRAMQMVGGQPTAREYAGLMPEGQQMPPQMPVAAQMPIGATEAMPMQGTMQQVPQGQQQPIDINSINWSQVDPRDIPTLLNYMQAENQKRQEAINEQRRLQQGQQKIDIAAEALEEKKQKPVREYVKERQKEFGDAKRLRRLSNRITEMLPEIEQLWPNAAERIGRTALDTIIGGRSSPEQFTQDPKLREYLRLLREYIPLYERFTSAAGRQTKASLDLAEKGKASFLMPFESHKAMVNEMNELTTDVFDSYKYMRGLYNPETERYPQDLAERVSEYEIEKLTKGNPQLERYAEEQANTDLGKPGPGISPQEQEVPGVPPALQGAQGEQPSQPQTPETRGTQVEPSPGTEPTTMTQEFQDLAQQQAPEPQGLVKGPESWSYLERWLGRKLPGTPTTPEEKAEVRRAFQDIEETLGPIANDVGSILSLPVTGLLGVPGSIQEGIIRPLMGVSGYLTKAATLGMWNTPFFQDIVDKYPGIQFPTPKDLNELLRKGMPTTRIGDMVNDFARDLVSVYSLVPLASPSAKKFVIGTGIGKLAKHGLKSLGFGEGVQEGADALGVLLGTALPTRKYFERTAASLMNKGESSLADISKKVDIENYIEAATNLYEQAIRGGQSPGKKQIIGFVENIIKNTEKLQNPTFLAKESKSLSNVFPTLNSEARQYWKELHDALGKTMDKFGSLGSKEKIAIDTLKQGRDLYRTYAQSLTTKDIFQKLFDKIPSSMKIGSGALSLYGITRHPVLGIGSAVAGAAGLPLAAAAYNAINALKSPTARKFYLNSLKAAGSNNARLFGRSLKNLSDYLEKK
jgi:hypothetical protein